MPSSTLKTTVLSLLDAELKDRGFKKKKAIYTLTIDDEIIGWLGLNEATRREKGAFFINPVVGIIHKTVEELVFKLTHRDNVKSLTPTVVRSIGYLTKDRNYKEWKFEESKDKSHVIKDMVYTIINVGVPWMKTLKNKEQLLSLLLEPTVGIPDLKCYTLPAIWLILGKRDEAIKYANETLERHKENSSFVSEYRQFMQKL